MNNWPRNRTTLTTAGTAEAEVGNHIFRYMLRSDGANDSKVEFFIRNSSGAPFMTDECVSTYLAVPGPDIRVEPGLLIWAKVSGTGGAVDIMWS